MEVVRRLAETLAIHGRRMPPGHPKKYFKDHPRGVYNMSDPASAARAAGMTSLGPFAWQFSCFLLMFVIVVLLCRWGVSWEEARELRDKGEKLSQHDDDEAAARKPLRGDAGVARRGSAASRSDRLDMSEVRAHLEACKLANYLDALEAHGYDDWTEILEMDGPKLAKLVARAGMSSNHADRFLGVVQRAAGV